MNGHMNTRLEKRSRFDQPKNEPGSPVSLLPISYVSFAYLPLPPSLFIYIVSPHPFFNGLLLMLSERRCTMRVAWGGSSLVQSLPDLSMLTPWLYGPLTTLARILILLYYLPYALKYSLSSHVTHSLHLPDILIWPFPLLSFLLFHSSEIPPFTPRKIPGTHFR
jgi:hypothetical protein